MPEFVDEYEDAYQQDAVDEFQARRGWRVEGVRTERRRGALTARPHTHKRPPESVAMRATVVDERNCVIRFRVAVTHLLA
jgi:hypothetical protein